MNNNNYNYDEYFDADSEYVSVCDLYDEKREKSVFSKIGFGLTLFSLISTAVATVVMIIIGMISPSIAQSTLFQNMITPVALYLFALPVLLLMLGGVKAEAPQKRNMKASTWFLILLIAFGVMYIGSYIGTFFMTGLTEIMSLFGEFESSNALNELINLNDLWITVIFVVIVAPVGEELVFRKLIIDRLGRYGAFVSIFVSALAFGLMHGNFYQFFYAFGVGLIFGYVYYNTGKIHLTIILHAVINFFGSVLSTWLLSGLESFTAAWEKISPDDTVGMVEVYSQHIGVILAMLLFISFVLTAIVCAIVLPIVLRKKIVLEKGRIDLPRGKRFSTVVCNPGSIVMYASYFILLLLDILLRFNF